MRSDSRITIGVVTYNSANVISECLNSIEMTCGKSIQVIVCDNNSNDETVNIVKTDYPFVEIINTGANYGFGYGVNTIIEHSKSPYVLILNADIRIETSTVEPLIETLEQYPKCVIASPVTFSSENNIEGNIRAFPSVKHQLFESMLGGSIAERLGQSEIIRNEIQSENPQVVDWIKGAIWCVRKDQFIDLGKMRTDFFLYSEETEFAARVSDAGLTSMITARAKAVHLGGKSDENSLLYSLLHLNKIYYFKIRGQKLSAQCIRLILMLGMLLRINKPQCRAGFISILKSFFGLDRERKSLIKALGGSISVSLSV